MREQSGTLTVAVSDPTHLQAPLRIGIDRGAYQQATGDPTVTFEQLHPDVSFVVDVQGSHGATHTAEFSHGQESSQRRTVSTAAPAADAYVRDGGYADTNDGSDTALVVKTAPGTGFNRRSFLRFAAVPNRPVDRAVLWVSAFTADSGGTTTQVAAHALGGSWQESTMTWNTQPPLGARLAQATVTNIQDWISFDVTGYVRHAAASGSPIDIALAEDADGLAVIISSREAGQPPFLEVVAEE